VTGRFAAATWTVALEPGENRDAARVAMDRDGTAARLAVSDGASSTLYSGTWARLLADAAVTGWPALGAQELHRRLDAMRSSFDPLTEQAVTNIAIQNKWHDYGSQATLVAAELSLDGTDQVAVSVLAVGDSVVLLLGDDETIVFPPIASADFTRTPRLITSRPGEPVAALRWAGSVPAQHLVVLASDGAARVLTGLIERDGTQECRRRLARLAAAGRTGDAGGADLALALLGESGPAAFGDDATVVLCAVVADVPGLADQELLARHLRRRPGQPAAPVPGPERAGLLRRLLSGVWPPR
jgi:hypothetical protein